MSFGDRRGALDALHRARPAVGRMEFSRGAEATIADIAEGWGAVEAALRALVGNNMLTGQSLIREARQRQLLTFDQANALAEFEAANDRAQRPGYQPTEADVNAARTAFLKLETALMHEPAVAPPVGAASPGSASSPYAAPSPYSAPAAASAAAPPPGDAAIPPAGLEPYRRSRQPWLVPVLAVLVLIAVGLGLFFTLRARGETGDSLAQGIQYYQAGQREAAAGAFTKAVRENPNDARPHIYLGRMAREVGNMTLANQELQLAIQADPTNALALREMGAYLLAAGNPDLARKFYVRAIEQDPNDKVAMGWLGCALVRLNNVAAAQSFFARAGPGDWSRCAPAAPPGMPPTGQLPR